MKKYILPIAAMAAVMCACGDSGFKVTGNIEGAAATTKMVLETLRGLPTPLSWCLNHLTAVDGLSSTR